jgi:hypothetical protein
VSQATLSLALGLVSILGLLFFIQIPAGIVGLVLGIRSLHSSARGRAIAGTVLSSVGLLIFMWLAYGLVDVVRHVGFQPLLNEVLGR